MEGDLVAREQLPPDLPTPALVAPRARDVAVPATPDENGLEALERQFLVDTMRRVGGNAVAVAKQLGISRSTMYRKLKKHGIT